MHVRVVPHAVFRTGGGERNYFVFAACVWRWYSSMNLCRGDVQVCDFCYAVTLLYSLLYGLAATPPNYSSSYRYFLSGIIHSFPGHSELDHTNFKISFVFWPLRVPT